MLSWLFSDPLPVGAPAPPFQCLDDQGEKFELSQARGKKVILVFYPGDDTPICTRQLCNLRDNWNLLQSAGATVYGVNPGDKDSHGRFRQKNQLPFPLLVDEDRHIARMYNCSGVLVKRTVYVLDEAGIIIYTKRGKPSAAEIVKAIQRH